MKSFQSKNNSGTCETGLILSGGVARGFAHIGVLQAMHDRGIIPDAVSGVSAGSIVGAFYCDGYSPEEILDIFCGRRLFELVRISARGPGFLAMRGLRETLKSSLRSKDFEGLKKPLWITVTNYCTGHAEFLDSGSLVEAVIASSSIPVLFKPQKIGDNYYIDGGITNNFPVEPLSGKCKHLLGAYVNPVSRIDKPKGIFQMALRSFQLSISSSILEKKKRMTVFIEPRNLEKYGLFEVAKGREMYKVGYRAAEEVLEAWTPTSSTM